MILHDWPETQALIILKNVVAAIAEDSVVLIHKVILSETDFVHFDARMDWQLMGMGELERIEEQWWELVAKVGLEIRGVWWEEEGTKVKKALIECGLKR